MGIKEDIINLLKRHPDGLTVTQISRMLKRSRITITRYVAELYGRGDIKVREVGRAKLLYYNR